MKRARFFFVAMFCAASLWAQVEQEWVVSLPMTPTAFQLEEGEMYMAGYTQNGYKYNARVIKLDPSGREYAVGSVQGGGLTTILWAIGVKDGLVAVAGQTALNPISPTNSFSLLTSMVGQWEENYSSSGRYHRATAVAFDPAEGIYVIGESQGDSTDWDIVLIRYPKEGGDPVWIKRWDSDRRYDSPRGLLLVDNGGSVIVVGNSWHYRESDPDSVKLGTLDIIASKISADGNEAWVNRYDGGWGDEAVDLVGIPEGIAILGESWGPEEHNMVTYAIADTIQLWAKVISGVRAVGIEADPHGVYSLGTTNIGSVVVKYDPATGRQMWESHIDGAGIGICIDAGIYVLTGDNGYLVTKLNPDDGSEIWAVQGRSGDEAIGLSLDDDDNIYVVGKRGGAGFVAKYRQTEASVVDDSPPLATPLDYELAQNYPNPFNPTTTIDYALRVNGKVRLSVYDLMGKEVALLVDGIQSAGNHEVQFSGANLTSGVYFYKLRADDQVITRKMILVK